LVTLILRYIMLTLFLKDTFFPSSYTAFYTPSLPLCSTKIVQLVILSVGRWAEGMSGAIPSIPNPLSWRPIPDCQWYRMSGLGQPRTPFSSEWTCYLSQRWLGGKFLPQSCRHCFFRKSGAYPAIRTSFGSFAGFRTTATIATEACWLPS
jgi:hypothetical protein